MLPAQVVVPQAQQAIQALLVIPEPQALPVLPEQGQRALQEIQVYKVTPDQPAQRVQPVRA